MLYAEVSIQQGQWAEAALTWDLCEAGTPVHMNLSSVSSTPTTPSQTQHEEGLDRQSRGQCRVTGQGEILHRLVVPSSQLVSSVLSLCSYNCSCPEKSATSLLDFC